MADASKNDQVAGMPEIAKDLAEGLMNGSVKIPMAERKNLYEGDPFSAFNVRIAGKSAEATKALAGFLEKALRIVEPIDALTDKEVAAAQIAYKTVKKFTEQSQFDDDNATIEQSIAHLNRMDARSMALLTPDNTLGAAKADSRENSRRAAQSKGPGRTGAIVLPKVRHQFAPVRHSGGSDNDGPGR